jgi:hypothetical protein
MKFKGSFKAPKLRVKAYQKVLHDYLAEVIAKAAFEWLGAVLPHVPVWSGASAATFLPLARRVGYQLTIQPLLYARRSRVDLGLSHANADMSVATDGSRATFTYSTTLAHLIWNEYHNANVDPDPTKWPPPNELVEPGPYHFQDAGAKKFKQFADDVMLPSPWKFVTVKEYRVR